MPTSASVIKNVDTVNLAILVSNEVVCRGLDAVLRTLPIVEKVHRCVTREQATATLSAERFDVIIVAAADMEWLSNPRLSGATAGSRVLVLVDEASADAVAFSADGVLFQQNLSPLTLRNALRPPAAQSHRTAGPAAVATLRSKPAAGNGQSTRSRTVNLTTREVEALGLLVKGLSNKQIARSLAISGHGAKRLVASILLKLDSPNRTTAAVAAIKSGLIECP